MDPFDDLLRGVRARGAVLGRSVLTPPWALRFTDGAYLTLCIPLRGEGWILPGGGGPPRRVGLGEVAVVRGPEPFVFADGPEGADRVPLDVRCAAVREDDGPEGRTVLMVGAYQVPAAVPRRLLRTLPPVAVVPEDHDCSAMRPYIEAQLTACAPGRQIVLDRLLDWLLVCTLREWYDRPEADRPPWYRALADEVAGTALRAMHESPERPWTLASLAALAGVSRTTLAKRFTDLVGQPPLAYLTEWRMDLAADLLTDPTTTVASVARAVGYADAFGFSTAFTRVRGVRPSEYRGGRAGEGEEVTGDAPSATPGRLSAPPPAPAPGRGARAVGPGG
ncbi:AraC family transcriptional regulator [Streptomyces capparidis]